MEFYKAALDDNTRIGDECAVIPNDAVRV